LTIDIICPLYKAENYIKKLHDTLEMQKNVNIQNIRYIITKCKTDNTENIVKQLNCICTIIDKSEFSHSLTREEEAKKSKADIVVFITQDIKIKNNDWLYELTKSIESGECSACYSRQMCDNTTIEKYTRECNYPNISKIVSKDDIKKLGLNTFFYSDASSAIKRDIFEKLNYYDGKKLVISEDMYLAHKIIVNNYKIKYAAESIVWHSHKFSLKQVFLRYYDTGRFFKQNSYLYKYNVNKSGKSLARYILSRAIQEMNIPVILDFIPNMAARFLGMKLGKL